MKNQKGSVVFELLLIVMLVAAVVASNPLSFYYVANRILSPVLSIIFGV